MRGESGLTASDVALLSGRNGNNDGFGDNGSWWVIIFLIFAFMGWGRNNNGFGGGNGSGATDNYVLASDFATIQRQLSDGFGDLTAQSRYIQNGLCDGFYAMNTSLLNGFAGVNNNITQNTIGNMQNTYAITAQMTGLVNSVANVGCDLGNKFTAAYADLNYNLASQECNTRQAVADAKADIIAEVNAGTRSILDFLTQDKIASLITENQSLRAAASQAAQNAYLINALQPSPVPAYIVANPNTAYNPCGCGTL